MSRLCRQKLDRLRHILQEREPWRERVEQVKRMRQWVLDAEHLLDGPWSEHAPPTPQGEQRAQEAPNQPAWQANNEEVGNRFDRWLSALRQTLVMEEASEIERECLQHFLQVLANARPFLIQCYDLPGFPRTNNEMESAIRRIKARYRRISGRKNWNAYLLRYGRRLVFSEWWQTNAHQQHQFEHLARQVSPALWRQMRRETISAHREQLKRFRFRHKRETYLCSLERRWVAARSLLLP